MSELFFHYCAIQLFLLDIMTNNKDVSTEETVFFSINFFSLTFIVIKVYLKCQQVCGEKDSLEKYSLII